MRLLLLAVLMLYIVALTVLESGAVQLSCQIGWKRHVNICYRFSKTSRSWNDAKSVCKTLSSQLAEAKTIGTIRFLKRNAKIYKKTYWLGGSDLVKEGVWVWTTSGERFTVTDWHSIEPNNDKGNEHCMNIHSSLDYKWNDDNCLSRNYFICEKTLISVR